MSQNDATFAAQGACRGKSAVMSAAALDYSPTDESYAHLSDTQHAEHAAAKIAAEDVAENICLSCPVMFTCLAWGLDNAPISGFLGGHTEEARNEMLRASGREVPTEVEVLAPTYRDRGPRSQVDDDAVVHLTAMGRNSQQIADELGCAERTVVRARTRVAARTAEQEENTTAETTHADEVLTALNFIDVEQVVDLDVPSPRRSPAPVPVRALTSTATPAAAPSPVAAAEPAVTAPPVAVTGTSRARSAAMQVIYTLLSDGGWHTRESLLAAGVVHVSDEDALAWWLNQNSTKTPDGQRHLPASKATTPHAERIRAGARDKANNALAASTRVRGNTERGGPHGNDMDLYRLSARGVASLAPRDEQVLAGAR